MAILNYASQLSEVLQHLNVTDVKNTSAANLPKLFFTGEGDIITHGINYLSLFNASATGKGLVPSNTSGNVKQILRGNATWAELTTADLPMWSTGNYTNNQLLTALQIQQLFDSRLAANDAMIFKGVVASQDDVTSPWSVGDTYRVSAAGQTFFGEKAEIGDLLICVKDGKNTDEDINTHWSVVQTNIEGKTTISVNNAALPVYAGSSAIIGKTYSIYGPTTGGIANDNTVLIGSKSATGTPTWATLAGLTINNNKLTLLTASTSVLGGVKIDSNKGFNNKPTVSVTSDGIIYLTAANIEAALGYIPVDPDNASLYELVLGAADATTNATTNVSNPYINLVGSNTTKIQISGSGKITAVGNSGKITLTLGAADTSDYGGIKVAKANNYTVTTVTSSIAANVTTGKYYGVELDSTGKAFVYVPWDNNTWREIRINGTSIGNKILDIKPSSDINFVVDNASTTDVYELSLGISWYNISTNSYETA